MTSRSSALVDVQLGLVQALGSLRMATAKHPTLGLSLGPTRDLLEDHLEFVAALAQRWNEQPPPSKVDAAAIDASDAALSTGCRAAGARGGYKCPEV